MKKRFLGLVMVAAMSLGMMTGCGNGTDTKTTSAADDKATTSAADENKDTTAENKDTAASDEQYGKGHKIGITIPSVGNDFMLALSNLMKERLEAIGCEVQVDSAESDVTKQISQIENDVSMGCDVIVIWPTNGEGVSAACKNAEDQGVKTLAFASPIPDAAASMISASDAEMGEACAKMASEWVDKTFADAADGSVKAIVLTSSTIPEAVPRSDGLKKIADNKKVTVVATEEVADWNDANATRTLVENLFLTNPDVNMIITPNGTTGKGAESYVMSSAANIADLSKFGIFCVDEDDEIDAKIKDSATDKSVIRGTISMGTMDDTLRDFMTALEPMIKGGDIKDVNGTAYVITADTVK